MKIETEYGVFEEFTLMRILKESIGMAIEINNHFQRCCEGIANV